MKPTQFALNRKLLVKALKHAIKHSDNGYSAFSITPPHEDYIDYLPNFQLVIRTNGRNRTDWTCVMIRSFDDHGNWIEIGGMPQFKLGIEEMNNLLTYLNLEDDAMAFVDVRHTDNGIQASFGLPSAQFPMIFRGLDADASNETMPDTAKNNPNRLLTCAYDLKEYLRQLDLYPKMKGIKCDSRILFKYGSDGASISYAGNPGISKKVTTPLVAFDISGEFVFNRRDVPKSGVLFPEGDCMVVKSGFVSFGRNGRGRMKADIGCISRILP